MDVRAVPQFKTFDDWQFFFINGANLAITIEHGAGESVVPDEAGLGFNITLKTTEQVPRDAVYVQLAHMTYFTTRTRRVEQVDPKDTPVAKHLARLANQGKRRSLPSTEDTQE